MTDKSYVTMEQQACLVCGDTFDTGSILMDKRLKDKFEAKTVTGWGLCPEHKKLHEDGFIALVAIDETKSHKVHGTCTPDSVWRTGRLIHISKATAMKLMNLSVEEFSEPLFWVSDEVIDALEAIVASNTELEGDIHEP